MREVIVDVDGKKGVGVEIPLPKVPLVLVKGEKGFVMCGYLNVAAAETVGEAAAMVKGVKTISDLLKANVVSVTKEAERNGVRPGMTGEDALSHLF